ncbi:hypothetical protein BpHYR1_007090 [Brachionus plicatilis]|uniref:Uncharacterized protein n=1 Tax=Brachionus plicatilis TaxID=10195 RepID=A0A3M7SY66_BRAPC|nr:hypothetical protein BpHYR1_007090 [Brachionus plicatilis]
MESVDSSALRDQSSKNYKHEIRKLKELLIKQQRILNKMNDENLQLNQKLDFFEKSTVACNQTNLSLRELLDQNKSLKEQLLLSQYYGSKLLRELNETKEKLKKSTLKSEKCEQSKNKN